MLEPVRRYSAAIATAAKRGARSAPGEGIVSFFMVYVFYP